MPAQILFFRLLSLEEAEWFAPDGTVQRGPLTDCAAQLGSARSILVVQGEEVIVHPVAVPSRKRSTWARAVPYALEDQLVEDIDALHFTMGNALEAGQLPVAVVAHKTLRSWLAVCSDAGLVPVAVIPESLLLPWQEGDWSLLLENHRAIVRMGRWQGFATEQDTLELLLSQALIEAGPAKPQRLRVWSERTPTFVDPDLAAIELVLEPGPVAALPVFASAYQASDVLNLMQGPYSRQAQWGRWLQPWRATAALAIAWLVVQGGAHLYENWRLQQEQVFLTAEMERVYKDAVPGATRIVNPKVQLETRLRELGSQNSSTGAFFELLSRGGQPLANFPVVSLRGFNYRDGQLELALQGGDPAVLDQLRQQFNQQAGLQTDMRTTQREGQIESKVTLKKDDGNKDDVKKDDAKKDDS